MVKVHKMFCIESQVADFLKGRNASKLVNRLLKNYIKEHDFKQMNASDLKKWIKIEKLKEELNKRIKEAENNG